MKERLDYIDLTKFIGITMMVLCHAGMQNSLTQWIYSFHMPLFFIISGMCLSQHPTESYVQYLSRKTKSLLIPYFIFALILCFGHGGIKDWLYILYASRNAICIAGCYTYLWFVPCFFISSILFFAIQKVSSGKLIYSLILSLIIGMVGFSISRFIPIEKLGLPFSLNISMVGVFLMEIGLFVKKCHKVLNDSVLLVVSGGGCFMLNHRL